MKLGYELTIEQTQKLSMTPELIQAIQILQFNNQELVDYVQNELLENPVLEAEKEYDTQEVDIREKIREADYEEESFKQWEYSPDEDDDYTYEQYVSEEDTLTDYLFMQLQFSNLKGKHAAIGKYIIEAVDDNGYLTASVEEIAQAVDAEIEDVEDTLNFIQTFDPAGIAARNLRECLIIQLASKGLLTDEIEYIIENMLEDLADNKIAHIAKTLNMKNQEVQQIADLIKTLEPKPGRLFSSGETTRYVIPDIFVEKINDEFVVTNNDTSVPKLMVSSYYNKLSAEADKDEELNKYLNDRFNAAVWLIKSIEQRKQTIYNVASAVVKYQQDFFDKGEKYLKTLT
ncbi:MAG: RNA polymerase factor sigma-54, partial [Emergencia timonensis]